MKRRVGFVLVIVWAVTVCSGVCFFLPPQSQARDVTPVERAKFDTSFSLADNLKMYKGKNLIVHLKSGKTLQGIVKAVGTNTVHLEKLTGKDFYDALIRIDQITAIEAKFREMK
jgi:small nuclear ribonucleoprotein (snRNP)-like protein